MTNFIEIKDDLGTWKTWRSSTIKGVSLHSGKDNMHYLNVSIETPESSLMSFNPVMRENTYSLKYKERERAEEAYTLVQSAMNILPAPAMEKSLQPSDE